MSGTNSGETEAVRDVPNPNNQAVWSGSWDGERHDSCARTGHQVCQLCPMLYSGKDSVTLLPHCEHRDTSCLHLVLLESNPSAPGWEQQDLGLNTCCSCSSANMDWNNECLRYSLELSRTFSFFSILVSAVGFVKGEVTVKFPVPRCYFNLIQIVLIMEIKEPTVMESNSQASCIKQHQLFFYYLSY